MECGRGLEVVINLSKNDWLCLSSLILQLLLCVALSVGDVTLEMFCETETFNATCGVGEAILMTHAQYGRMRLSRCVRHDYGHVGCGADVLAAVDRRCSGRRTCEIVIPDASFTVAHPCPQDLKPYLEAAYRCVTGSWPANWRLITQLMVQMLQTFR